MKLKDKVAIVTGSAGAIGSAIAKRFVLEGAYVVCSDISNEEQFKEQQSELYNNTSHVLYWKTNIADESDVKQCVDKCVERFGKVDILVNNAAVFVLKGLEATVEEWQQCLNVNIIGTALMSKYASENMKKNSSGAIVNISSISGFVAQSNFTVYSSTKASLLQMTRNMAMDLGKSGIRVNSVSPGSILTPASYKHSEQHGISIETFIEQEQRHC
jgi:NAD(P)-dependent dehydrogenase (short-subunit alcohol dehydrogenase family)